LFLGDAAAATDPMTGEGIGQALLSGMEAARAILAGGTVSEIAHRYERSVATELVADHKMARALANVLANSRGCELAIGASGLTGWTKRNFARWLFEDYPRAMVLTPRRWHRRMFTGDGAYQSLYRN